MQDKVIYIYEFLYKHLSQIINLFNVDGVFFALLKEHGIILELDKKAMVYKLVQ